MAGHDGAATGPQSRAVFTDAGGVHPFAAWKGAVGYPAGVRLLWMVTLSAGVGGNPAVR